MAGGPLPDRSLKLPWLMAGCTIALMVIGLTAIERGDRLEQSGGELFARQAVWCGLAIPVLIGAQLIPVRRLRPIGIPLLALAIGLLVAVYFFPPRNGARRWIPLGPIFFQPSELAKLALVLALAQYLMFRRSYRSLPGLIPPFLFALVPALLIVREPDLGTALVFPPVLFCMLFAAGARKRHLFGVLLLGALMLPVVWQQMSAEQKSRVTTLVTQSDSGEAPRGDGYHLFQSKRMHSLGGTWGSQFGGVPPVDPAAYHLPAARTDFVFCLITERWGAWGAGLALALCGLLFARGLAIADRTRDPYNRLVAVGVTSLVAVQTTINAAMTVGLMPITGLPLPLMSYGGSSLLFTVAGIGLLLNIGLRPGFDLRRSPFPPTR